MQSLCTYIDGFNFVPELPFFESKKESVCEHLSENSQSTVKNTISLLYNNIH